MPNWCNNSFAITGCIESIKDLWEAAQTAGPDGEFGLLRQTLVDCQADEVSHRDEAARLALPKRGAFMRLWCVIVGYGSAAAVVAAKRV